MNPISGRLAWSLLGLATLVALTVAPSNLYAANADESPLDGLIPPHIRAQIDARKSSQNRGSVDQRLLFAGRRSVDLSSRDTSIKRQFAALPCGSTKPEEEVGTCTAFSLAAAIENSMGDHLDLSERHLWSQYCRPASSSAIAAITRGTGVVSNQVWPDGSVKSPGHLGAAARYKVFSFRNLQDDRRAMLAALESGYPLYLALNTPSEMYARQAIVHASSGNTGGGHAVAIVGYELDDSVEGGGYLLVKNSWGTSNGNHGYQWLSLGYCERAGNYCVAWSIERAGKN